MADITDSLLLTPNNNKKLGFKSWLNSTQSFVQQLINSGAEEGFNQHILDILFDGIWITDKNDVIIYANNAISHIVGVPQDRIVGTEIINGFSVKTFQHFIPFYLKAKDEGCPIQYDSIPVITPTGRLSHQTGWLIPRFDKDHFNGVICSVSDVTESKQLAHSEARWQAICDCSPDCIMLIDLSGVILYMNHPVSGFSLDEMVGTNIRNVIPEPSRKEVENCLKRVRKTGAFDRYYTEYPTREGGIDYFEARVGPIIQDGNVIAYIVNSSDITRQKLLEKEIKKHQSNLEDTNITLKVLLKRIETERLLFQENLSTNILCNIEPYMNKLKQTNIDKDQKRTLEILDQNIKDMASPLVYSVMTMNLRLTPAEMQISNFIRQGYSSKEIAELLNISPATIDKHRKNIRKKLGITNKKQNLRSVLSSISS
jgi:PAS domain S-box-containing protein